MPLTSACHPSLTSWLLTLLANPHRIPSSHDPTPCRPSPHGGAQRGYPAKARPAHHSIRRLLTQSVTLGDPRQNLGATERRTVTRDSALIPSIPVQYHTTTAVQQLLSAPRINTALWQGTPPTTALPSHTMPCVLPAQGSTTTGMVPDTPTQAPPQ